MWEVARSAHSGAVTARDRTRAADTFGHNELLCTERKVPWNSEDVDALHLLFLSGLKPASRRFEPASNVRVETSVIRDTVGLAAMANIGCVSCRPRVRTDDHPRMIPLASC